MGSVGLGTYLYVAASHEEKFPLVPQAQHWPEQAAVDSCGKAQLQSFAHEIKPGDIPGEMRALESISAQVCSEARNVFWEGGA